MLLLLVQAIVLRNGDMEAGTALPSSWESKWVGRGTVSAARDTEVRHGGEASLRIDSRGDSQGQISQTVDAKAGSVVTISGWVRSSGRIKAVVAFQPFAGDWSKNEFKAIGFAQGETDWRRFSERVTVPEWAARFGVGVLVEGEGKAWLDDVTLEGDGVGKEDKTVPPDVQEPTIPYRGY